jgi:arabinogalactan endo-1,4-beta-galactosidase
MVSIPSLVVSQKPIPWNLQCSPRLDVPYSQTDRLTVNIKELLCAASVLLVCDSGGAEFIAGADFSHLKFFEDRGIVYKDEGEWRDGLEIVKKRGLTCVRLRLFTSNADQAQLNPYNYTNNLDYTLPLAVRVKKAGLKFLLDFHYSDSWADPGKQRKPAAWTNLGVCRAREANVPVQQQFGCRAKGRRRDARLCADWQ